MHASCYVCCCLHVKIVGLFMAFWTLAMCDIAENATFKSCRLYASTTLFHRPWWALSNNDEFCLRWRVCMFSGSSQKLTDSLLFFVKSIYRLRSSVLPVHTHTIQYVLWYAHDQACKIRLESPKVAGCAMHQILEPVGLSRATPHCLYKYYMTITCFDWCCTLHISVYINYKYKKMHK